MPASPSSPLPVQPSPSTPPASRTARLAGLVLGLVLLAAAAMAGLMVGARPVAPGVVLEALLAFDPASAEHIVVRDYRLPRLVIALLCGPAFGVAGALIQAATRNPLADPGILGVNAGAAFAMTLAAGFLGVSSLAACLWFSFLGAILVTLAVYALASTGRDGATPLRLVLAGVAFSATLGGLGTALALASPQAFDALRHWSTGSLAGRDMAVAATVAPFVGAGLALALLAARPLNAVALGEELARSLGANVLRTRILVVTAVTLLAGAATAAAGPIGFLGLMTPHAVRRFTGPDQRWILPLTMIHAPALLIAADVAGRLLPGPGELEAGIVTAFLGAPVLILMARRKGARGL